MAEIIEFRPPETGLDDQIFNAACEMEGDLRAIDGFADALALVSGTMDESPHANAINGLAWEIKHRAQRMEARRDNLFTRVLPNGGALLQLVAIDDCALNARHVVEDAALDERVYARVAEQDQRGTIIIAARIPRDLPSLREQLVDRQRCLRCRQAGRRQHHCQE
jgi:hypothetical protein